MLKSKYVKPMRTRLVAGALIAYLFCIAQATGQHTVTSTLQHVKNLEALIIESIKEICDDVVQTITSNFFRIQVPAIQRTVQGIIEYN